MDKPICIGKNEGLVIQLIPCWHIFDYKYLFDYVNKSKCFDCPECGQKCDNLNEMKRDDDQKTISDEYIEFKINHWIKWLRECMHMQRGSSGILNCFSINTQFNCMDYKPHIECWDVEKEGGINAHYKPIKYGGGPIYKFFKTSEEQKKEQEIVTQP